MAAHHGTWLFEAHWANAIDKLNVGTRIHKTMIKRILRALFGTGSVDRPFHEGQQPAATTRSGTSDREQHPRLDVTAGTRTETEVYENDFMGNQIAVRGSPFRIVVGARTDTTDTSDRHFRFYRGIELVREGRVPRPIEQADLLADGRFCLLLPSRDDAVGNEVWFFDATGKQVKTTFIPGHVSFVRLQNSWSILIAADDVITHLTLEPLVQRCHFNVPWGFSPTDGAICNDGSIHLRDGDRGVFRFQSDGTFVDHAAWRRRFLETSSGELVYRMIHTEYTECAEAASRWTSEQCAEAVRWLDLALTRGIADSYSIKRSDVFTLKANLLRHSGDVASAEKAEAGAEECKDGFRVIDEAEMVLKRGQLSDEDVTRQLALLAKAADYPRIRQYPNYFSKLLRFRGELFAMRGMRTEAIRALEEALALNPKVGCKRQLESLRRQVQP